MSKSMTLFVLLAAFAVGLSTGASAFAEEEDSPLLEDYFATEAVYPQERGEIQFTVSPAYTEGDEGEAFSFDVGAEVGLTDRLQFEVEWPAFQDIDPDDGESVDGSGDFEVGLKYTFDECERTGIRLALGFETTFPAGNDDISENAYVYEPFVILSRDFGEDFNLHLHAAYGFVDPDDDGDEELGEDEEELDELEINLGSVYRLSADWRLTLEASLESNEPDDGDETELYLIPGFLWKGLEGFEMGLAAGVGLTDDSDDWQVLGMLSYEFELLGDDD